MLEHPELPMLMAFFSDIRENGSIPIGERPEFLQRALPIIRDIRIKVRSEQRALLHPDEERQRIESSDDSPTSKFIQKALGGLISEIGEKANADEASHKGFQLMALDRIEADIRALARSLGWQLTEPGRGK